MYRVECIEWSLDEKDITLEECPYCEQSWLRGQQVITHPTLSLYGAATVLLEEIKRGIDEPLKHTGLVNKVLCFSDGRQQAAFIASRLQRTNEDFTFRQAMFRLIRDAGTR